MKGHIRKRGKSWAVVFDLGRDASGKRHQKWHAVPGTRRDAQRELARLLNELNTGAYVEPSRMTISEFLDRWLADYAKPKVSPKTFERYQEMIDGHIRPALGSYLLPKLAPLHIQAFYSHALAAGRKDGREPDSTGNAQCRASFSENASTRRRERRFPTTPTKLPREG